MALTTVELGSFTPGTTGNTTININGTETPTLIDFWVGPRSGTVETTNIGSFGTVDIVNGNATWQSNYTSDTGSRTHNGSGGATTSSCLQHYAGTTKLIDLKFVSATSGSFTLNVLTSNSSYTVFCRVYG